MQRFLRIKIYDPAFAMFPANARVAGSVGMGKPIPYSAVDFSLPRQAAYPSSRVAARRASKRMRSLSRVKKAPFS